MERFNLRNFVESNETVSFEMLKQGFEQIIFESELIKPFSCIDVLHICQDISAAVCIGHTFNRLAEDVESYGTVDVFMWCNQLDTIYYTLVDICDTQATQDICLDLMLHKVKQIVVQINKILIKL
jgi:hypothetical protein